MKLSVVIVSYNVRHLLAQCVDSVLRATKDMEAEVWVVDNASTDGSLPYLQSLFPRVHVIANEENVGFARANNQAIRLSQGHYVLLLNPDTIVAEDTLSTVVGFMEEHARAGAAGVHMLNRDGSFALESRRGMPKPSTALYKLSGLAARYPQHRRFGRYYMQYLNEHEAAQVEVLSGAFMLLRREALLEAGLLDEDYFMYGEDIDLSYRVMQAGWDNYYVPASILHYKGESTRKTNFRYVYNFYNAMLIFFRKHYARRYRLASLVVQPALVALGLWQYLRRKLQQAWHWVRVSSYRIVHNGDAPADAPEHVVFVGSYEGWACLQPLLAKARLVPDRHVDVDSQPDLVVELTQRPPARLDETTYVVFQTDCDVLTYSYVLHQMEALHEAGVVAIIGTYNLGRGTLILPGAAFA